MVVELTDAKQKKKMLTGITIVTNSRDNDSHKNKSKKVGAYPPL